MPEATGRHDIFPRSKWWWLGLALLLALAGWLYLRGYNHGLPFIRHNDEAHHLLAGQHMVDMGHAKGVSHQAYPPAMRTLIYLFLKHLKPAEAHHGTMLPALRLTTILAWTLVVVLVALLGALMAHPLTGLMAAAFWVVNPWIVNHAHYTLPDGYLTLFTLLALWLALIGALQHRRSFSTAAVYSIMLAITFKTQAMFVAPIVVLLPALTLWRAPACRAESLRQTVWNCLRFAIFLFWLVLIYPTLDVDSIVYFPTSYSSVNLPRLGSAWASLQNVLVSFMPLEHWLAIALACSLLWRFRQRVNATAFATIVGAALFWLLGMSMFNIQSRRHYFAVAALMALIFGAGMTGLLFAGQELLARVPALPVSPRFRRPVTTAAVLLLLALYLLPSYQRSDRRAFRLSLHDRRGDLMRYMDTSLPPGRYISEWNEPNHKTFNRSWGGYDGVHDFPLAQKVSDLLEKPLEVWRGNDAVYAIAPYPDDADDPQVYFPDETVLLKSYPPDPQFRGPSMVVLRLYPMQYQADGQLGPIRLAGYDLNARSFSAGDDLTLRHYWRAEQPTTAVLDVYNHLFDADGDLVAQVDYVPLWDDRRPTTAWDDPDEILLGREFVMTLPPNLPPGDYQLFSGFYDPATGQRLKNDAGDDRLFISEITIIEPGL